MSGKFKFAIDRGGTFTDIFAVCPNGKVRVMKLLSEDPDRYEDAPTEGIKRILAEETGQVYGPDDVINESCLEWIRMGTTVATNALLERKGERVALAITQGFKDVLYIGNQSRPDIFSLDVKCPDVLYESVIEVQERAIIDFDYQEELIPCPKTGALSMMVTVEIPLDTEKLKHDLCKVYSNGIRSLAVVLAHSYSFNAHEQLVGQIAKEIGFQHVSLSSEVMPMIRLVPRGQTTCVDAYLTPCIKRYIANFTSGFENELKDVELLFMQSDGGLTPVSSFCGSRALLSGPAGGVVGYSVTAYEKFNKLPVIGFDMGGTSTDVSRFDGQYDHVYDTAVAGVSIQAPQLDIQTVAAGGGSMLFFRSGLLVVGPESAGANPGPVCYRKGGPLTITDANLCLGRLQPDYFPKIFGSTNNLPLDKKSTWEQMELLAKKVNEFINPKKEETCDRLSVEELALGFIAVANEAMCRPIRLLTQGKGFDPSNHLLACFGGAGSQHACSIAKALGLSTVFIHRYAGILSSYGMALAQIVEEIQEAFNISFTNTNILNIDRRIGQLADVCMEKLKQHGFQRENILFETYLNMRYEGSNCAIMCSSTPIIARPPNCSDADYEKIFVEKYEREFGFRMENRAILVEDLRIRAIGGHSLEINTVIPRMTEPPSPQTVVKCYFEGGYQETPVYLMKDLLYGHGMTGPSLIIDDNCTILVEPYCSAFVTEDGSIVIKIGDSDMKKITTELNVIHLSVFSHRFMSIAEQMGRVLQRTAVSTNVKERLDFSCALFGPDGGLVSNAPHIPVHLGSMQEAVRFQIHNLGADIKEGDVILSNHPCAGGSHLPDLTVITPVFIPGEEEPIFFVASRGHHADIGGLTPGSMPSNSKSLMEEGARFISFKLVDKGVFQEKALLDILYEPANYPGCAGARNVKDNLSDLKAQVAANKKGINLVKELIKAYGLDVVQAYMYHIQHNAETTVKDMLKQLPQQKLKNWCGTLQASDHMDDGTIIQLLVEVNVHEGTAVFDFTGTGIEVYGNWNTPKAVVFSAIIYCLRCMVGHDIPLNQGCLNPIKIVIPQGCILFPSHTAAVVGGNVLTSQRIVDVIFKAFGVCAASQGCMNNITFGDGIVSYYETIAGGAGAGPSWNGRSGIHTHMTNTRITDLEILEQRYPVFLKKFELRSGSGGSGIFKGGDGIIRELMFRKPLTLSVLTERRVFAPYGLKDGACGKKGVNHIIDDKGKVVNLGSKASLKVDKGYRLHIETPGGGGFGDPTEISETQK